MPFYQMLCIAAHFKEYQHIKGLVKQAATLVMDEGGVVRRLSSWGTLSLPQRMRRHKHYHQIGDYWTMDFDVSPQSLRKLNTMLAKDHRVVRWTVIKQGEKVEDIVDTRAKTKF